MHPLKLYSLSKYSECSLIVCDKSNVTFSSPASYSCLTANCKVVSVSQGRWWASCTNHIVLWAWLVRLIGWSIIWTAGKGSDHQLLSWNKGCNNHRKSSSSLKTWSVSHSSKSLPLLSYFISVKTTVRIRISFYCIPAGRLSTIFDFIYHASKSCIVSLLQDDCYGKNMQQSCQLCAIVTQRTTVQLHSWGLDLNYGLLNGVMMCLLEVLEKTNLMMRVSVFIFGWC